MTMVLAPAGKKILHEALRYPGARLDRPWGEYAIKVGKKVFVFLGNDGGEFGMSVKLPASSLVALNFGFASPTGYGLCKAGWVTARFKQREKIPVDLLMLWVDESYRAIAPKKLIAELGGKPATRKTKTSTARSRKK